MTEVTSIRLEEVKKLVQDHISGTAVELTPETNFADDLNCDSLDMIELAMAFEEQYEIEISDEETESVETIADAVALLERKIG